MDIPGLRNTVWQDEPAAEGHRRCEQGQLHHAGQPAKHASGPRSRSYSNRGPDEDTFGSKATFKIKYTRCVLQSRIIMARVYRKSCSCRCCRSAFAWMGLDHRCC